MPLSDKILDHYENPRNVGELEEPSAVGIVENPVCGDVLQLYVHIAQGRVTRATSRTFGCAPAIAASSVLTEMISGMTLEQVRSLGKEDVTEALGGLPPMKEHCSVLAADAVQAVLRDFARRSTSP